jgi:hypothetical protein
MKKANPYRPNGNAPADTGASTCGAFLFLCETA